MGNKNVDDPEGLFSDIGAPKELKTAADGKAAAEEIQRAISDKKAIVARGLDMQQADIQAGITLTKKRLNAVRSNHVGFDLNTVLSGWFDNSELRGASSQITARRNTQLNIETAASYGTVPDNVVQQFVNSSATQATAKARMEVAKVLDRATGITRRVAEDSSISAEQVSEKAQQLLKFWNNAVLLNINYQILFGKTLNRVVDYQKRLAVVGNDLAKKQVTLESISSSLVARQALVKKCLLETCVAGLALDCILERENKNLEKLMGERKRDPNTPAQVFAQRIQEQEALIETLTKRLVDLKAFAIKLIGLYSVLGNTRFNVAIVKADVVFTRTNLMATLGLQLGLVVDVLATLRISKSARDIREAEAEASEKVGVASEALNEAANTALTEVETTIRSLKATITAAINGIENTHANLQRVENMSDSAEAEFSNLFASLAI